MNAALQSRETAQCIAGMKARLAESGRVRHTTATVCQWLGPAIVVTLSLALLFGSAHAPATGDLPEHGGAGLLLSDKEKSRR